MRNFFLAFILLAMPFISKAQDTTEWDLQRCVDYAIQNNISVKESDVQARIAHLQSLLTNAQRIPTLNFNTQAGFNFGRSIDPTTNQYTTQSIFFQSYSLQTGVTLFNFFNIKNNHLSALIDEKGYQVGVEKARNDIALNVAASYLQYLLSIEQANAAKIQIAQTQSQLNNTQKLVDAGSVPELSAAQLEAQLATDSSTYITANGTAEQNRIGLMGLLDLDAASPFKVSLPDVAKIPIEQLAELQPGYVYDLAMHNQPLQKADSLHIKAAQYAVKSTRGAMYPSLSAFGQLGSNYASTFQEFKGSQLFGFDTVFTHAGDYITEPNVEPIYNKPSYLRQVGNINFTQAVGLQLNIPILSNRSLRTNYERAKLNVENLQLQSQQDNITLQQNVYQAYSNSVSALQKYNATTKADQIQQYALSLAKKRYELGVLSTIDYITTQNNAFTATINALSARYDYVFKMKVLEFYKGFGIKLN
jgi:outer membrane protein